MGREELGNARFFSLIIALSIFLEPDIGMPVAQAHKYFKQLIYGVVSSFPCFFLHKEFIFSLCTKL